MLYKDNENIIRSSCLYVFSFVSELKAPPFSYNS